MSGVLIASHKDSSLTMTTTNIIAVLGVTGHVGQALLLPLLRDSQHFDEIRVVTQRTDLVMTHPSIQVIQGDYCGCRQGRSHEGSEGMR